MARNQNLMWPKKGYFEPSVRAGRNCSRRAKTSSPKASRRPAIGTIARYSGFANSMLSRKRRLMASISTCAVPYPRRRRTGVPSPFICSSSGGSISRGASRARRTASALLVRS